MKWLIRAVIAALRVKTHKDVSGEMSANLTVSSDIRTAPRKAFDVSNFWLPFPVLDDMALAITRKFFDQGFSGVMIGVYRKAMAIALQQYNAAKAAGLWTDTFAYMYFDDLDHERLEACTQLPGGVCWVDCELTDGAINEMSHAQVVWYIWQRTEWVWQLGLKPGIYTRKQWWETYTGNEAWFAQQGYLLWDANDLPFKPYGGWAKPAWTQYAWEQKANGANVDLSIEGSL